MNASLQDCKPSNSTWEAFLQECLQAGMLARFLSCMNASLPAGIPDRGDRGDPVRNGGEGHHGAGALRGGVLAAVQPSAADTALGGVHQAPSSKVSPMIVLMFVSPSMRSRVKRFPG